jgi:hypothetical protein
MARLAVEQPLQFRPAPRLVAETHALSLSNKRSILRGVVKAVVKRDFNF